MRPQYKPNMNTNPTKDMHTTKKYFFAGELDISLYTSPRFSTTFTWKKKTFLNYITYKSIAFIDNIHELNSLIFQFNAVG